MKNYQGFKMKLVLENWRKFVNEVKNLVCPPATQDVDLNTENRNATRQNHMYGPLNVEEPGDYWQKLAEKWNTEEEAARIVAEEMARKLEEAKAQ